MKTFFFVAALVLAAPAFADDTTPLKESGDSLKAPHQDDAGRLVSHARDLRGEKGCAAAAPAYRVAAAMGEGEEAAQHELGECLLELEGKNEIETALFRQEAEFWLTRAAFAGNARAQRKLAMEMASPASPLHNPKGALMWALVYANNPTADLYGYKALPATLAPGLRASLSEADAAEAQSFVQDFAPIALAKYEAPGREGPPKSKAAQGLNGGRR